MIIDCNLLMKTLEDVRNTEVYLDGNYVNFCVYADDVRGVVRVQVKDQAGNFVLDPDKPGERLEHEIFGKVTYKDKRGNQDA